MKRKIEVITEGHPDDVRDANESIAWAHSRIDAFADEHKEELLQLVLTYGDCDAESKLADLREKFWARLFEGAK